MSLHAARDEIACATCRARGAASFAPSDAGFYVCVRCGTQSQTQIANLAEIGLEDADDGDAFVPGAGRVSGRSLRARRAKSARKSATRAGKRARDAARDPGTAAEAYARAFQAVLMTQTRAVATLMDDARDASEKRLENAVRDVWGRYLRASGTLEREGGGTTTTTASGEADDGDEDERTKSTTARFVKDRLPMVMSLGLLYLALARRRAAILPFELAKMAAEGSLPYLNVYDVVHEHCGENTVELLPSDEIFLFEHPKRIPTPQRIVAAAAFAAAKIDAQLPPINAAAILTRYVGTLFNLDSQVLHAARRTLSVYLSPALRYGAKNVVGAPESALLAYVVVALKFLYGLDGRTHTQARVQISRNGVLGKIVRPSIQGVPPGGWSAWARGVGALGAPALPWSEDYVSKLDDCDKDRHIRFAYHRLLSGRIMPFPFNRIEEKLLKVVPPTRLNADASVPAPPPPPAPSTTDPQLECLKAKHALAESYETRVRVHCAHAVIDELKLANPEVGVDFNNELRRACVRSVRLRAGGLALRHVTDERASSLIARNVNIFMHEKEESIVHAVGGQQIISRMRLDSLVRRVLAATFKSDDAFDGALAKRLIRTILKAVETEDPDLNAEFTNNERISYIKETISDLAREQEHLNAVLRLDPDWKGYDDGSERTAKIIDEHICVRTAGSYLPAASANNVFDACPAEYVQIVEALARFAWINPEALHESVMELELVLLGVEKMIAVEKTKNKKALKKRKR